MSAFSICSHYLKKGYLLILNGRPYTICNVVGEGGQCIVYEAAWIDEQTKSERTVILRELFPAKYGAEREGDSWVSFKHNDRESWLAHFNEEFKNHTNISEKIRSAFSYPQQYVEANNTAYMIFSPESSTSCDQIFPKASLRFIVKVLSKTAEIVAKMHSVGMAHGDLKPENILLLNYNKDKEEAEVRIIDCGTLLNLKEPQRDVFISYTKRYAAPEMKNQNSERISAAVDVYSIAAMLVEAIGILPEKFIGRVEYSDIKEPVRYEAFALINDILKHNLATSIRARHDAIKLSNNLNSLYENLGDNEGVWRDEQNKIEFPKLLHEAYLLKKNISETAASAYIGKHEPVSLFCEERMEHVTDYAWRCYQRGNKDECVFIFAEEEKLAVGLTEGVAIREKWRMHGLFGKALSNIGKTDEADKQHTIANKFNVSEGDKLEAYAGALNYLEERFEFDQVVNEAKSAMAGKEYIKTLFPLTWLKLKGKEAQNLTYKGDLQEATPIFEEIREVLKDLPEIDERTANRKQSISYILNYYLDDLTSENKRSFYEWQKEYFDCEPFIDDCADPDRYAAEFIDALRQLRNSDAGSNLPYMLFTLLKAAYKFKLGEHMCATHIAEVLMAEKENCISYHPYELILKYKFLLAVQADYEPLALTCLENMELPCFADIHDDNKCQTVQIISAAALCECAKAANMEERFTYYYERLCGKIKQAQETNTIACGYFDRLDDPEETLKKFRYMYA